MHKPESVQENETPKIIWNVKTKADNQVLVRISNLVLINKRAKTCLLVDFTVPESHGVKIKQKDRQIPGPCSREENVVEHEVDDDTNRNRILWNSSQEPGKKIGEMEI